KVLSPPAAFTAAGASADSAIAIPQWRLRASHLEKLSDNGRVWQRVAIPGVETVTNVATIAGTIWAGASPAAIYYSGDGGAHWTRQWSYAQSHPLGAEDPNAQIIRLQFDDESYGRMEISTSSARWPHQLWITNDGGTSWLLETTN